MIDVFGRLYLYVLAGQVALQNQLLSQADAVYRAAITLLPEVPVRLAGALGTFFSPFSFFSVVLLRLREPSSRQ